MGSVTFVTVRQRRFTDEPLHSVRSATGLTSRRWRRQKRRSRRGHLLYRLPSFFMCAGLCPCRTPRKMHLLSPRRDFETHPAVLKCHGAKSKGQFRLEPVAPYQSAVVFAVLVGQVGNGGRDAGAEELLPLVQVALVDFVEELVVSAHNNRGSSGLTGARGLSRKINNTEAGAAVFFFFSPPTPR